MTRQPVPGLHENFAGEAAMSTEQLEDTLERTIALDVATMSTAMRNRYRAALAQAEQPVAVKPLEWRGPDCGFYEADTIGGVVRIMDGLRDEPGRFILNPASGKREKFDTLEEAMVAAQANYEQRILSALATNKEPPVPRAMVSDTPSAALEASHE